MSGASSGFFEEIKACYVAGSFERPTSYEATGTNERIPRHDATGSDERPTTHTRAKTNERPTTYKVGFTKRQAEALCELMTAGGVIATTNLNNRSLSVPPKTPSKPLRASVDAALALNEIPQQLVQVLVFCGVP